MLTVLTRHEKALLHISFSFFRTSITECEALAATVHKKSFVVLVDCDTSSLMAMCRQS